VRLAKLENGHGLTEKLILYLIRGLSLTPFDVVKTFMYRPDYFGRPFCDFAQAVMRGPSEWSVGERELLGAFTSQLNRCRF
jgi:hypothetical protein